MPKVQKSNLLQKFAVRVVLLTEELEHTLLNINLL